MPCKVLSMVSPYTKLYGKDPELQNLNVFGSAVYPWLRPYSAHKLLPRSNQCVFLGYFRGYKGVICYNVQGQKCIVSRHVIFDETMFPYTLIKSKAQGQRVTSSQPSYSMVIVPVSVQHKSSAHANTINPERNMDSFLDHGTAFATHTHAPPSVSTSHINSSSARSDTGTQGFETHVFPDTFSSSQDTVPLLPVLDPSQLQVILPLSIPNAQTQSQSHNHNIQTRLKTGAIMRRDYTSCLAALPELASIQLQAHDTKDINGHIPCGFSFMADIHEEEEPKTFRIASTMCQWQSAMQEEYDALKSQGTWKLVPPPSDKGVIGSKWVYKVKRNPDGTVSRYKARLVAQGFGQEHRLDY
ncbi:hypothetical protein ACFX1S_032519 [Malus domestica]